MDWFKYSKNYGTDYTTTNVMLNYETTNQETRNFVKFDDVVDDYIEGVVADVTDSYKELSSERVKE